MRLRQKLSSATSAVKNFFSGGQGAGEPDLAVQKLEQLQVGVCGRVCQRACVLGGDGRVSRGTTRGSHTRRCTTHASKPALASVPRARN